MSVPGPREPRIAHLLLVLAVSALYETRFLHHWLNVVDEGWPLYAAMRLHQGGGALYREIFFVFPPGHLLPAWLAQALDPPGVVLARALYASFNVALCLSLYLLGCRVMPARHALLGALLVSLAAPLSHRAHLLFGYRYLVFSTLALLAFARRLAGGGARWMLAAGCLTGVAVCFRLTPAFAVSLGIGFGALTAAGRDWRRALADLARFAAGVALVALPVVAWFSLEVGPATLWREVVARPVAMTALQSLPMPPLALPTHWDREEIHDAFVALLFRGVALLYAVYASLLIARWLRSLARRRRFDQPLLLAIVTWGGIYYLRSLGRSDEPHLSSAIPPFCLLLVHALHAAQRRLEAREILSGRRRGALAALASGVLLAGWVVLPGADRPFDAAFRGSTPFRPLKGRVLLRSEDWWHVVAPQLEAIRELTEPTDTILDLSASPLFYVLTGRSGPGQRDVIMPGTFLDAQEERAFLAGLERDPPALVIVPVQPFDDDRSRSLARTAPLLVDWVARHYGVVGDPENFLLLRPREPRVFGTR